MAKKKTEQAPALNAVIYARYSSHSQREESIEQQVAECRAYASQNLLRVIEVYSDSAISGRSDRRVAFQRMLRDAERGRFQVVIAYKSNRIARNMLNALQYEAKLQTFGIRTVYAKEEFGDSAAGRFALRTMMNVNQFYSENMAEDIRRGMLDNAQACKVNGLVSLGYKRGEDGRYAIDEPAADIVREIFRRYLAGEALAVIAEDLNSRGVHTSSGGRWNKGSFHRMLVNENYIGVYKYSDIRIEGGVPPIIEREVFAAVQNKLKEKKSPQARRRDDADYLLTGKLICGKCGSYMVGTSGTGKAGDLHYYYVCHKKRVERGCDKENIRRDYIEQRVAELTQSAILRSDVLEWIVKSAVKAQEEARAESDADRIEAELREQRKAQKNVLEAIRQGIITASTKDMLLDIEANITELTNSLALAKARDIPFDRDTLLYSLSHLKGGDPADKAYQRTLIDSFVRSVTLYDDNRIRIDYYYGDATSTYNLSSSASDLPDVSSNPECSLNLPSGPPQESQANTAYIIVSPHGFSLICPLDYMA